MPDHILCGVILEKNIVPLKLAVDKNEMVKFWCYFPSLTVISHLIGELGRDAAMGQETL